MNYTIYHGTLPNGRRKIGVDSQYPNRIKQQKLADHFVMEVHTDIYEVSDREQELQELHDVEVDDVPFHITYRMGKNNKGRRFSASVNKSKGVFGHTNSTGFKHTDAAKQAISNAVNNRPTIECPNCKKVLKGNSKFKQHFDSARCKKEALKHEKL